VIDGCSRAGVRYEAKTARPIPHIFGPLNDAVIAVKPFPLQPDGSFLPPELWLWGYTMGRREFFMSTLCRVPLLSMCIFRFAENTHAYFTIPMSSGRRAGWNYRRRYGDTAG